MRGGRRAAHMEGVGAAVCKEKERERRGKCTFQMSPCPAIRYALRWSSVKIKESNWKRKEDGGGGWTTTWLICSFCLGDEGEIIPVQPLHQFRIQKCIPGMTVNACIIMHNYE